MISRHIPKWGRYLSAGVATLLVLARLGNFWGLHYANTDDITMDFWRMTVPLWAMARHYAISQSRIQFFLAIPLWAGMMRFAGTPWYDLLNLGSFTLGALLPAFALRRYYFPGSDFPLYAVAFFAPLPLLFSYPPPYSYPLYTSLPLVLCAVAVILFQGSQLKHSDPPRIRWRLATGTVATFFAVCAYESTAVLSLVILAAYFAASRFGKPWKSLLHRRDFQCAAAAIAFYGAIYIAFRAAHPPVYEGVKTSAAYLSLPSLARVAGTLSLTSSVYAWFRLPQLSYSAAPFRATLSLNRASTPEIAMAILTALAVFVWIVRPTRSGVRPKPLTLGVLAFILFFVPNMPYALTPKIASLVTTGKLFAYIATPYSQFGFACAVVALAAASARIPVRPLKILAAAILAVFVGCGSLAASGFNRESAVVAQEQAARWNVVRNLAACSGRIPEAYFQNLAAPGMWKFSTAPISWGDEGQQDLYWDALAFNRYGLRVHLTAQPGDAPVRQLDYRTKSDGSLDYVILATSADGKQFQDTWLISAGAATGWDLSSTAFPCLDGLQAMHATGDNLQPGTLTSLAPLQPSPALPASPTEPSLEPRSGTGMDQVFRVSLPPLDQGEVVRQVGLLINGMKTGVDGCHVFWDLQTHETRLANDNGVDSRVSIPGHSLANGQCDLLPAGTTYRSGGNTIDLAFHVRFHDSFKGLKQMYLFRKNTKGGNSGLNRAGWWWVE